MGSRRLRRLCEKLQSSPILPCRSLVRARVCVRVRGDTKETDSVCEARCIVCTTIRARPRMLSRAWAVDFSKHIITESQLHDASAHGNGAIR